METWIWSIFIVATFEMLLSVILPGLVIYMVLFKTPPEFKHFSVLLLIYSAVDSAGALGGWISFNQRSGVNATDGFITVYVSYGACGLVGSRFCYIVEMMNYTPLMFNLTLTTFNMGYRLFLLHKKTPEFKVILLLLTASAIPWIIVTLQTMFAYVSPEEIHLYSTIEQAQSFENYTIFGQGGMVDWADQIVKASVIYPFGCCVLAMIFRYFIIRSIETMGRGISNRNYKLQREIVWVLTIQSCCPLLITIAVAAFFAAVAVNFTHPVFQTLTYPIMVLTTIIDATVTLYNILPYRVALLNWVGIKMVGRTRVRDSWISSS